MNEKRISIRDKVSLLLSICLIIFWLLIIVFIPHEDVEKAGFLALVFELMYLSPFVALFGVYFGVTSLKRGGNKYLAWSAITLNALIGMVTFIIFVFSIYGVEGTI